ncbi:MAG: ATP-binding protein [Leptolyngbyaceae cyanobacterium MO_188.B28]|nr:ATP-binding protein [Leptolyngbyaceae cyanobacterium MO_188.B28]
MVPTPSVNAGQKRLFRRTRWRLAAWYASILGVISSVGGVAIYRIAVYAHQITLEAELESAALVLHETLEPLLEVPGQLHPDATHFFPSACLAQDDCLQLTPVELQAIELIARDKYYIRLLAPSHKLLAVVGKQPKALQITKSDGKWQYLTDDDGVHYRQISLDLYLPDAQQWGSIQVGRSLQDFETYVANLQWMILIGVPGIVLLLAIASRYLADQAMQPIYQSYGQIQQFTADAAHELRTPLSAIRATVESMLMTPSLDEEEVRTNLRTIRRQDLQLSQLVADLLMLCRMDQQLSMFPKLPKEGDEVDLKDLAQAVTEEFAALALASALHLSTQLQTTSPLKVAGDSGQLHRLISNLVANALRYTPAEGKVTLILDRRADHALVHVQDTGIGIAPEELPRIFDRFYRVKNHQTIEVKGSGLGLSIAQAIAQTHRGKIQVQSELDKGSTFTVWLPMTDS